ncbi:MAG: integrase, partial [Mucilaginibacter sp.]|nr:integrase [Mucilaginibacter sp.]
TLAGSDLRRLFRMMWAPAAEGRPRRARRAAGAMDMLRSAVRYGCEAGFQDCVKLAAVLQGMKFRVDRSETFPHVRKARKVAMGFEHAEAIVKKGLAMGTARGRAVALGVAAQFEFTLRQIDVIGYWLPRNRIVMEPGMLAFGSKAWRPGLRFEDFASGTLDLSTTKNQTDAVFDVAEYPLFQLALAAVPEAERIGPLVSVVPGEPVRRRFYADIYREVANAAGVPRGIWNARARHGGVTEGKESGADIVDVSKHAQHSDVGTTVNDYFVATLDTTRRVIRSRVAKRNRDRETDGGAENRLPESPDTSFNT